MDGIREELKSTTNIDLSVEYLYTKNYNSERYFEILATLFREKYKNTSFDIIITSDDHALDFILDLKKYLFPLTPLVFCGVDHVTPERISDTAGIYEIKQGNATQKTIELVLGLLPGTTEIYFIGDTTKTGTTTMAGAKQLEKRFEDKVSFTYLKGMAVDDLFETLAHLPPTAAVIYLTFLKDSTGRTYSLQESQTMIAAHSKAPVFCTWGFTPETGIIGGAIMNGFKQGEFSTSTALQIISADKTTQIPLSQTAPLAYMIDYEALTAHGLKANVLPEQTQIFNQRARFRDDYNKYRNQIWAIATLIGILCTYTLILVGQKRKVGRLNSKLTTEITKRTDIQQELQESEEKFRTFFMLGKIGMAITSPNKGWIQVNEQVCAMLGYTEEELKETTWEELTHPDDLRSDERNFNKVMSGAIDSYSLEKRFIHKDGSIVPATLWLACLRNTDGSVKHFIAHISDDTLRKEAEQNYLKLNRELESKVQKRTQELEKKNTDLEEKTKILEEKSAELEKTTQNLQDLNKFFVDRELKMVELKKKIEMKNNDMYSER